MVLGGIWLFFVGLFCGSLLFFGVLGGFWWFFFYGSLQFSVILGGFRRFLVVLNDLVFFLLFSRFFLFCFL